MGMQYLQTLSVTPLACWHFAPAGVEEVVKGWVAWAELHLQSVSAAAVLLLPEQ